MASKKKVEPATPIFAVILFCIVVILLVVTYYPKNKSAELPRTSYAVYVAPEGPDVLGLGYFADYAGSNGQKLMVNSTGSGRITVKMAGFGNVTGPAGSSCLRDSSGIEACSYAASGATVAVFEVQGKTNPNAKYLFSSADPSEFWAEINLGNDYQCNSPCFDIYDPELAIAHEPDPLNVILVHNKYGKSELTISTIGFSLFLLDAGMLEENQNNDRMRELIFIPLAIGVVMIFLEYVVMNKLFVHLYHRTKDAVLGLFRRKKI